MARTVTKRNLKHGIVAFVDLLGFSARVEGIETEEELLALEDDVRFAQDAFRHKQTDEIVKESQRLMRRRSLAFSDCLVVLVPFHSPLAETQGDFDILMGELTDYALAQGDCVLRGIFIRGGVDMGFSFQRSETLISPPLVRAYQLEHDASVPMIAISSGMRRYFSGHPGRDYYSDDIDPYPATFTRCDIPGGKRKWFINYARVCLNSVDGRVLPEEREEYEAATPEEKHDMRNRFWARGCREWARQHRTVITTALNNASDDHIREKYLWLASYHNREIKRFFRRDAEEFSIALDAEPLIS